jgi:hypothetical protein
MTDSRSFLDKMKDDLVPSLVAGGIGIAAAKFIMDTDLSYNFNLLGVSIPGYIAIGGTIALSDAIAYAAHDFVLEKIPSIQTFATYENRLLAPVLSGIATYGIFRFGVSEDASLIHNLVLGGGSTIAGKYLYSSYEMANNPYTLPANSTANSIGSK